MKISFHFSASIDLDTLRQENYTVTLQIIAKDKGVPQFTSSPLEMTITVINVNEFHPQFPQASDWVSIPENATTLSEVYQASASDGDYGRFGTIVYDITAGNTDGYFSIATDTGIISTAKELDRETTPSGFDLTIEARGFSGAAPGASMILHVNITDINDNSPVFSAQVPAQTVSETAGISDLITQVGATDSDLGVNAEISFTITTGNTDGLFEVDGETGEIKVKKSLDLEGNDPPQSLSYTLAIVARDGGTPTQSATIDVDISITTENEFTPEFGNVSESINVTENASVNSEIYAAAATDLDYGTDGELEYSITAQNPAGYFTIDSQGNVTIAQALDREVTPGGITLTIQATDKPATGTAKSSTMELIVVITDYNDNTPDFTTQISPQEVSEAASVGDVIVQVEATDADLGTNAEVSYSITAGNSDDLFEIDGGTGEIKVKQSLDLESNDPPQNLSYTLTITASDGGSPEKSNSMDVQISILSENEFTPVFGNVSETINVTENASVNSEIYAVAATDLDYGTDGELEYSITAQNPAGYFTIDSQGNVTIAQALDREVTPSGTTLTIQATDKPDTGTAKSSTMELIVLITDYNDNTPDFTTQISPQQVSEGASVGDVIVQVEATDADLGTNAEVSYSITAGNSGDLYEIDGGTGEIKVKQSLDLESNDPPQNLSYTLTITASDGGSPQQSNSMDVQISILSENEFTPVFRNATDSVSVRENATVNTEVRLNMVWYGIVWYGMALCGMLWYNIS
jgi:ApbE superfamily uncharacterized protein (UPF0280 family)